MASIYLKAKYKKKLAVVMLGIMILELVSPNLAMALSSGPVQPEIQSFEPVGTTDMVDLFTGDFVYNIPLMDVEGYPVNISYHGGVTMDQEASWVGLGWNINPGAVNRAIRGLPDEFNGDTIEKELSIKEEINKKIGLEAVFEPVGIGQPILNAKASLGGYLNISNYRGVSVDFTSSVGVNTKLGMVSAGLNVGASIGSQAGAAINYDGNIGMTISQSVSKGMSAGAGFNLNQSGVYSPRTGVRESKGFSVGVSLSSQNGGSMGMGTGVSVPIGLQNHTAAITNASYMNTGGGQLKVGGEVFWMYLSAKCAGSITKIRYDLDGSRKGYGYFNLSEATDHDLLDFSREKDGMYNTTMSLLPHSVLTYDVYSVNGQGTGGSFRPFRNDMGSVFDPITESKQNADEGGVEAGLGNQFEIGGEFTSTETKSESGPWKTSDCYRKFKKQKGGYFEDIYFKEAGELTENNESYLNAFANNTPVTPEEVRDIPLTKTGANKRIVRANHIYPITGEDNDTALLLDSKAIVSYSDATGFANYPTVNKDVIPRVTNDDSKRLRRKKNQVTEIVQNQKDGRRYVYGLPVVNNVQREVVFAVDPNGGNTLDDTKYLVDYNAGVDDSKNNNKGMDHFYSSTVTPTYTTAHLLTGVLSSDYIDVTGNGITDDDLGTYTKFNYSRKSADYRWRSPIQSGKAQYMPGYTTDKRDDKAAYSIGSREQWMLHSIETKNYVAEFYVSARQDALGVLDRILNGGVANAYNQAPYNSSLSSGTNDNKSYKLDSIVLFNKHDRFKNAASAQSIKTIVFNYDYSLCKNVPNSSSGSGKLTLKKLQVKYGKSNLNMTAAYTFKYDNNPDYDEAAKDRWGNYKPNDNAQLNNFEFPFTKQSSETNGYAGAWSLNEIGLPSGGIIKVDYESDDYASVQNKEAMEMFKVQGFGNNAVFKPFDMLYLAAGIPNLFVYFKRRTDAENPILSPRENYLKGTDLLYYNVATELSPTKFEPIKGYAEVAEVGYCNSQYGYVQLKAKSLEGSGYSVNPITYAALNVGRYSLPHILFPGADPDATDMDNIAAGLKNSIKELFEIGSNPLANMMSISNPKAKRANYTKSFIRLTSPGLMKKGGGQRVKSIKFYDSWDAMAGGNQAIYGKNYKYTLKRDDGKGYISSGVASYEPMIGGDELPQRVPVGYTAQRGNNFPPNDPVDLYQELPVGESFYPGPVVGYSNVVVTSINKDVGRSSQTEDVSGFYTAKDFPIQAVPSGINSPAPVKDISLTNVTLEQTVSQGFSLVFNDMHGKPRNTEHWLLKPTDTIRGRELLNMQKYEYLTKDGRLSNLVPVFDYSPNAGKLSVAYHKMGIETDLTMDTRMRREETKVNSFSGNLNAAWAAMFLIPIPVGYYFGYTNTIKFKSATATKLTQQYGILNKVISSNEGAVTEVRNEVFDINTGNALVTSVNNEFNDREYNVAYPAYWAYKELGPSYTNHDMTGIFKNDMVVDSFGIYSTRFVNYNPSFSTQYQLPRNMPVARIIVDEDMPKFKLGDEMLLKTGPSAQPIKTWTMGYSTDIDHCYLILATREPYKLGGLWSLGNTFSNVEYRVIRSGNRNRLGETIQSYTTSDASNIFPYLKDSLTNLINLNAQTYKHNLNQVYAANLISDSLNPFVTGKVGLYRPEQQILNVKNRTYSGGTTRNAGIFASPSYWKTELDNYAGYCPDSSVCFDCGPAECTNVIDRFTLSFLGQDIYGNDSIKVKFKPFNNPSCSNPSFDLRQMIWGVASTWPGLPYGPFGPHPIFNYTSNSVDSFIYIQPDTIRNGFDIRYSNGCCSTSFRVSFDGNAFTITNPSYNYPGTSTPVSMINTYIQSPTFKYVRSGATHIPFRIRKKILLGYVGHYEGTDNENWVKTQQVTKYNWFGQELENKEEGIGYNTAIYGYNQQLPMCVAKNAQHSEVLYESFEDYALLKARADQNESYMPLLYSPFEPFFNGTSVLDQFYKLTNLSPGSFTANITTDDAHTGHYSIKVSSAVFIPLNASDDGMANGYSFKMASPRKYVASLWLKPTTAVSDARTAYAPNGVYVSMDTVTGSATPALKMFTLTPKSNIIEGWQKFEATFDAPVGYKNFKLQLADGYYYDDIRLFPFESNSKGFVYEAVSRKLMATLDENNYATFYEYDAEGNLVRTKKETEKGILTITESRSTHRKTN